MFKEMFFVISHYNRYLSRNCTEKFKHVALYLKQVFEFFSGIFHNLFHAYLLMSVFILFLIFCNVAGILFLLVNIGSSNKTKIISVA